MSMKQPDGSTHFSRYILLESLLSDGSGTEKRDSTHTSTLLILTLLASLYLIETLTIRDAIVQVEQIETKYTFNTREECLTKLNTLKTQHNLTTGLRCIPDGRINN